MKSFFRSARKPRPSTAGGGGRLKRRAPSPSDESGSDDDESLLPTQKRERRKRSSSPERNSESSSSGGKDRKICGGGRLRKRAASSSSDSSSDDDPLPPTRKRQKRRMRQTRLSFVQQSSSRRSRRSLGDRKMAAFEARQRYVKDRADSTRRRSKLKAADPEATWRTSASPVEVVAKKGSLLMIETPSRTRGNVVEDQTMHFNLTKESDNEVALASSASIWTPHAQDKNWYRQTPSTSNPLHGRRCLDCNRPLVVIGTDRKNGKRHHSDWLRRRYHKKCWKERLKRKETYECGFPRMHMRAQVHTCPECFGPCSVRTSLTKNNPNRQYYACACKATPGSGYREGFVQWV